MPTTIPSATVTSRLVATATQIATATRTPTASPSAFPTPRVPPQGQLVFVADFSKLYIVNADGTGLAQLLPQAPIFASPKWTLDGKDVYFLSDRGSEHGILDLYRITVQGSRLTRLTQDNFPDRSLALHGSPPQLAYISERVEANARHHDIFIVGANGQVIKRLTNDADDKLSLAWSPNGAYLVYITFQSQSSHTGLFLAKVEAGTTERILDDSITTQAPSWAPDNKHVAVSIERSGKPLLFSLDVISGSRTQLTQTTCWEPVWSPIGDRIACHGDQGVLIVNADGTNIRQVTTEIAIQYDRPYGLAWSSDGKFVAYASEQIDTASGHQELTIVNVDSQEKWKVTSNFGCCYIHDIDWFPR
jgi:Tol biopolymer transport system component